MRSAIAKDAIVEGLHFLASDPLDLVARKRLRVNLSDLAAKGAVHVIADMSRVDSLDSTSLGVLVGSLKRLREHDGSLTLVISAAHTLRLFEMTELTRVFPAQPSVLVAIAADPHWRQAAESEAGSAEEWCQQHGLS